MDNLNIAIPDRVKLPFQFDAGRLLDDVQKLKLHDYVFYNVIQLRGPAHLIDASRPIPPPADDYADGSWTEWLDSEALKRTTYLNEVLNFFKKHLTVNLVRLLRLEPGGIVQEHTDPTLGLHIKKSMIRLTIPILTNDRVQFILNGTTIPLQAGECWYIRLTDPHRVINQSAQERINLTLDVIPNPWLRNIIAEAV